MGERAACHFLEKTAAPDCAMRAQKWGALASHAEEILTSWPLLRSIVVAGADEIIGSGDRRRLASALLIFLKDWPALASGRLPIIAGSLELAPQVSKAYTTIVH